MGTYLENSGDGAAEKVAGPSGIVRGLQARE